MLIYLELLTAMVDNDPNVGVGVKYLYRDALE
jgi:hypothetical protein